MLEQQGQQLQSLGVKRTAWVLCRLIFWQENLGLCSWGASCFVPIFFFVFLSIKEKTFTIGFDSGEQHLLVTKKISMASLSYYFSYPRVGTGLHYLNASAKKDHSKNAKSVRAEISKKKRS